MPTQPPASPSQKNLMMGFVTLAQTAAASTGNQMSVMGQQITKFQDGVNLFKDRYSFWDLFISQYQLESRYLTGPYLTSPIVDADFQSFLNNQGRLYTSGSADVTRIGEFDTGGATTSDSTAEVFVIPPEAVARGLLLSGFTDGAIPSGLFTTAAITPGTTSVIVKNLAQSQVIIPVGVRILFSDGAQACIGLIQAVQENNLTPPVIPVIPPALPLPLVPPTYTYTLTIQIQTQHFTNIAIGATLVSHLAPFTDAERAAQTATLPQLQPILTSFVDFYRTAVTNWKTALDNQFTAIQGQTGEDAPDAAYVTAQAAARTQLTTYLTAVDVSNAGITPISTLASFRSSVLSTRINWILARLTATTAYDNRYKYSQLLYNLGDGQLTQLSKLQGQQTQLAGQQAASNARAATLQQEVN